METALQLIIKEAKVPQTVADQVTESLTPFYAKVEEWKKTIKTIVITDPSETGKMKMAREGRLALRQMSLNGTDIVKSNREIIKKRMESDVLEDKLWLKSGQIMELEYKTLEAQLEEKEKFAEVFESNRKKKLHEDRAIELSKYGWQDIGLMHLGEMDDGSYAALLNGTRIQHQEKLKAEAQAEVQRKEELRINQLHESRRIILRDKGLVNYISDFYSLNFGKMTDAEMKDVLIKAESAKAEYLDNQAKIQQAKDQAVRISESPEFTPTTVSEFPDKKSDKDRLIEYADALNGMIIPGFATKQGREIYEEARGYIAKVSARIKTQSQKL